MDDHFGQLEHTPTGQLQLRFTRKLRHPLDRVWRALTEPNTSPPGFPPIFTATAPRRGAALRIPPGRGPSHRRPDARV